MSSDMMAISAMAKVLIVCLLEVGLRETLGGRRAPTEGSSINRLC